MCAVLRYGEVLSEHVRVGRPRLRRYHVFAREGEWQTDLLRANQLSFAICQ